MTNQPRKTAKYYRDLLTSGNTYNAVKVLPEIIKKFGYKRWGKYSKGNDVLNLRKYTKYEWNHRINGFFLSDKGKLCVDIYWQGDSTDGNSSLYADECINGKTIPAEHEFIDGRTYYRHGDLRITAEEFRNAIKAVAQYLSPEEIKARKEADRKAALSDKVFEFIDAKKKGLDRWEMENFWNGRIAVQKVLEQNPKLLNLTFEELKPIVDKVFGNNNKSNYSLRGGWCSGEKKYNLAY